MPPDVNLVKAEFWYSENSDCSFRILTDHEVPKILFLDVMLPWRQPTGNLYMLVQMLYLLRFFLYLNTRLDLNVIFQSFYDPSVKLFKTYQVETLNGKLNVKDLSVKNNTNVLSSMDLIIIIVGFLLLGSYYLACCVTFIL